MQSASFSVSTGQVKVTIDDENEEEGEPELFVDPTLSTSKQKAHVWDLDTKTGYVLNQESSVVICVFNIKSSVGILTF